MNFEKEMKPFQEQIVDRLRELDALNQKLRKIRKIERKRSKRREREMER